MPGGRRRRGGGVGLAVGAALALTLAGCGVPVDRNPTKIAPAAVPFGLLAPSAPTTTTTTTPPVANQVLVHVFLVGSDGRLVSRNRLIGLPLGAGLDAVLDALLAGPTPAELAQGLQSAIPPQTRLLSTTVDGATVTIDLSATFGQVVGPAQLQAVAQLVFTATDQSGISDVALQVAGQAVPLPVTGGGQVPAADRAEFPNLAPSG